MAIYNRANNTPATTTAAPAVPSMDLGSIIVTSLQNAVESIQSEDKDTSLKDIIKQSLEESTVIRTIQTSSSKLSNLFGGKSNTTAKNEKGTPADKVMSSNLDKLLKSNTTAKNEKDTPADKMEKHMAELLQITKDDKKKERVNESKVVQEKKKEKEHKTTIKEGFSAVKAVGATIIKNILLILVAVQLIAELIVLIKYGWHYLMGVFIPNTWTKIKLAWTGFWAKIITQVKNFFVGLFNKIPGVHIGLSDEQKMEVAGYMKKATEDPGYASFKTNMDNINETVAQWNNAIKAYEEGSGDKLSFSGKEIADALLKNDAAEYRRMTSELKDAIKSEKKSREDMGDEGSHYYSQLDLIENMLNGTDGYDNLTWESQRVTSGAVNDWLGTKAGENWLKAREIYNSAGKEDPEKVAEKAQLALMTEDYKQGDISEAESTALLADKKYGTLVQKALTQAKADLGEDFKYEQDDKHEQWIKEYGEPWKESIKTMVNDLTQNIGINLQIGQNKSTPQVNEQNPNASKS